MASILRVGRSRSQLCLCLKETRSCCSVPLTVSAYTARWRAYLASEYLATAMGTTHLGVLLDQRPVGVVGLGPDLWRTLLAYSSSTVSWISILRRANSAKNISGSIAVSGGMTPRCVTSPRAIICAPMLSGMAIFL